MSSNKEVKGDECRDFDATDDLCVNTIRFLAVDGVERANSGHPGMPMGDSPMAYVLWSRFLRHNPNNPKWAGRDRFVLSAGHGSMLLYALLHLTGYNFSIEDLKNFRQWGSPTPGHPEYDIDRGIELTTGPLGQGISTGVGMAMAARYMSNRYDKPGFSFFDYNIFAICGDGDLMEGVSYESASLAGHLALGSLVYLYSDNKITIEGSTDKSFTEDVSARFEAMKWHVQKVDGNNLTEVAKAISLAKAEKKRPSIIISRTNIGFGSPAKQDSASAHGSPLGKDEIKITKEKLGWPDSPDFFVPEEALARFSEATVRGDDLEAVWNKDIKEYEVKHPELAKELGLLLNGGLIKDALETLPTFNPEDGGVATRSASGKALNAMAKKAPFLIGGSADLAPSNNTWLEDAGEFAPAESGQNIHYGVREHAMGSIMNGIALSRALIPFGGTFLVFSDYMRGAIRMAALSELPLVYVFTHDSIGLGEDGPTHQPIEHLASLRAIPGLLVLRPADANETSEAWRVALTSQGPSALILTRQKLRTLNPEVTKNFSKGGYVLADSGGVTPEVILIASGSEVEIAMDSFDELKGKGIKVRVVSMPCFELFDAQSEGYKEVVLPSGVSARVAIEAASPQGWHKYTGSKGIVMGIEHFGASAPQKTIYKEFGLTSEELTAQAERLLGKS
ncbi:MAG: transketolase [Deltaproteobacteria bacterium]|nr:transketolase [Deltaproteobacteria bacterium]